jgi:glycosyltransferase involved in cell wall biosynthesis
MAADLARWTIPVFHGTRMPFKRGGVVAAALAIVQAVKRARPDVVHLHTEVPELAYALACTLSRRVRQTPMLRTVHNVSLWIAWDRLGRWATQQLAHGEAVAVSQAAADADEAIATRTARPRPLVIPNGVMAVPTRTGPRRAGPVRVLFAGRLVTQKGADLLPAILKAAHGRAHVIPTEVTIAGTGAYRESIAQELAQPLPGWTVRFQDAIAQLSHRLHDYDAVLMPSRFEGFGLLALETLMAGVPLITTDAPGLDEVVPAAYPLRAPVDDGEALGAHLALVIADPEASRPMAAAFGARLAARFDPAAMAQAYLARYEALARRGAADGGQG